VAIGIETDRGLLVGALLAAGYQVYAVNPHAVGRYRGRHSSSGAKSDRGDAKVLADLVRTDRRNHRQVAGDTPAVEAVKVLARAHQSLNWARQRHVNALRSALREFYPGALAALGAQLAEPETLAVLKLAPTLEAGRQLTRAAMRRALVSAGRRRNLQAQVVAVHDALAAPPLACRCTSPGSRTPPPFPSPGWGSWTTCFTSLPPGRSATSSASGTCSSPSGSPGRCTASVGHDWRRLGPPTLATGGRQPGLPRPGAGSSPPSRAVWCA
jgi:Transposase